MIQFLNNPPRQSGLDVRHHTSDGPEQWSQWSGRKRYSLEVIQHPLRARMCGFGDKDRRPLAPAAVAKMTVQRDDNSLVDVDDVDCSFFVVTVDLWSADGKQEMNLVLHPSSADRYIPTHTAKPRRRGTSGSAPQRGSGHHTPSSRSTPTPSHYRDNGNGNNTSNPQYTPDNSNQGYYASQSSAPAENNPTWGYSSSQVDRNTPYPPPILPSLSFRTDAVVEGTTNPTDSWNESDLSYLSQLEGFPNQAIDPALRSSDTGRDSSDWPPRQQSQNYSGDSFMPPQYDNSSMYAQYPQQPVHQAYYQTPSSSQNAPPPPPPSHSMSLPRHTYTRTLVGPLSANATRLLDEHRKPGIFFLFQDLSVRTEGTFRLRMRLMNVGALPAPEPGSTRIHTDMSPVLAQTFTEPFTVYSAKRFPGVPDTTALSIAFGNQGQKLPLRNRNASGGKRRRRDDSGSEDDSDGA
ncbi:hypothetical protein L218DRAFT_959248 [Marasmius fiardii PR-910]|nr:hypothetical protein L218DRAFT_959248 [Marasmius fiardii PR-910]